MLFYAAGEDVRESVKLGQELHTWQGHVVACFKFSQAASSVWVKGPSIKNVRKIFRIFDPLPPLVRILV